MVFHVRFENIFHLLKMTVNCINKNKENEEKRAFKTPQIRL